MRNGYDDIKVTFKIDADASKKDIEAIVAQSQKRSAVYDVITNPMNVTVEVVCTGASGAPIERVTTVVIGAGHAGLAASRLLTERSIDHVVLERGEVANSWRRERWDSLRLLTPNWQSRLPGYRYDGPDPDGYMTMREVIAFISRYRRRVARAGAHAHDGHVAVGAHDDGYHVATSDGDFRCRCGRDRERRLQSRQPCRRFDARSAGRRSSTSRRSTTAIRRSCPKAACSSSAPRRPACSWPHEIHRSGRPRDAVGRRARAPAAYVSRPRRALVDGGLRRLESALRRDRRPHARPPAAVAAARRNARADARSISTR